MAFDWKSIIKTVAPSLATALGGSLAGNATKAIANVLLGNSDASEQEIEQGIANATPEQLMKLKELDNQFYALEVQDRASARGREVDLAKSGFRDWTPSLLAFLTLFCTVGLIVFFSINGFDETEKSIIFMMIQLCTAFFMYYYGDSNRKHKQ
jgi:hypothetical protein